MARMIFDIRRQKESNPFNFYDQMTQPKNKREQRAWKDESEEESPLQAFLSFGYVSAA
jgi:hypothetical protein